MSSNKKRVVIVGCGAFGSQLTAKLAKKPDLYKVTVLTPFEYMEVSVKMTKVLGVGPEEHEKAIYPLLREDGVEYVIGQCAAITESRVQIVSGHTIPFDVCVVAVGHRIPIFLPNPSGEERTMEKRKQTITNLYSDILRANHIVIAGGGPIGTETAADIKLRHKDKHITLVHSHAEVLSAMKDPFRLKATAFLEKIGIELIMSDKVREVKDGEALLESGKRLQCDLFIPAHPISGNATFLPSDSLDEHNYAIVDNAFRVKGFQNVFAGGDCNNFYSDKTGVKVGDMLPTMVENVELYCAGKPLKEHVKAGHLLGQVQGPALVAFGHGLDEGYGVGPNFPGCLGACFWCMCGCQAPAGHWAAKMKSDFNDSFEPQKGKGIYKK